MTDFEEMRPECDGSVNVTTFRHNEKVYTISTTDVRHLANIQAKFDRNEGYFGELGNYETMLFINQKSMVYPFGDLPGHRGLGVFQRYDTEEQARDGHQEFVTRIQRTLSRKK